MKNVLMLLICVLFCSIKVVYAQIKPVAYHKNLHSHNDYTRNNPFALAYSLGFGSIEVDLFLKDGELYVAHEYHEIKAEHTFDQLYLQPILRAFEHSQDGYLYPDQGQLQLLIDPKANGKGILSVLMNKIKPYRELFDSKHNPRAVKLVISGQGPQPEEFDQYDEVFYFDGDLDKRYTASQLDRIELFSASFKQFSEWNGLGRLTREDSLSVKNVVDSVQQLGKRIRFWATPDTKTTWYEWLKMGIDYINTDKPIEAAQFMQSYLKSVFINDAFYEPYQPSKIKKPKSTRPKNVILLISDGAGISQLWAAALVNKGKLNVLNMPYTGYLFTGSTDNYHTDSAAGGSALATGVKTRNRHIGTDASGAPVQNIPDQLAKIGMVSGILSNDDITGATPSAFYAHVSERDQTDSIAAQLLDSKLSLMIGSFHEVFARTDSVLIKELRSNGVTVLQGTQQMDSDNKRLLIFGEDQVDRKWDKLRDDQNDIKTDYRLIEELFQPSVDYLKKKAGNKGFFLMVEGAKIDGGGHSNSIPFTVTEYLSFDRMAGQALRYADLDGETLVLVTSDHETGGLIILDGESKRGTVLGNFATTDHTGIPVPLMSYGPGAELFQGFLHNTDIANLIYQLLGVSDN